MWRRICWRNSRGRSKKWFLEGGSECVFDGSEGFFGDAGNDILCSWDSRSQEIMICALMFRMLFVLVDDLCAKIVSWNIVCVVRI